MINSKNENNIMQQNGFYYDCQQNGFIKKGYGLFLTNTNEFLESDHDYLSKMQKSDLWNYYIIRGIELIVGPPAPTSDGNFTSKSAVYIKNYKDIIVTSIGHWEKNKIKNPDSSKTLEMAKNQAKSKFSKKLANPDMLTDNQITSIVNNFQRLIDNYKVAIMHSYFGINVYDMAINNLYSYEEEILSKYKNENLYNLLCALKKGLKEGNKCKEHIIYTLTNGLLTQNFSFPTSINIENFVSEGLRIINNYNIAQKHGMLGLNIEAVNNSAIDNIHAFIQKVNNCSLEERYGILCGIEKYFSDKKSQLPDAAVEIISELRNSIMEEKFAEKQSKSKTKK